MFLFLGIFQKQKKMKSDKYLPISNWFNEQGYKMIYMHLNCMYDLSNLLEEVEKFRHLFKCEFDIDFMCRIKDVLEDKLEWVHNNIDKEIFEKLKVERLRKSVDDIDPVFLDELRYINIGSYNDIDINLSSFEDFNKGFETYDHIKDKYKKTHTEERFIETVKLLLQDENVINKYQDAKLSKEQFDSALKFITDKNENYDYWIPKPTHHVLIPLHGDYDYTKNEQESILSFCDTYVKDYVLMEREFKSPVVDFMFSLYKEILWSLNESDDYKHNIDLFNERDDYLPKKRF